MKKAFALLLSLAMLCTFAGCSKDKEKKEKFTCDGCLNEKTSTKNEREFGGVNLVLCDDCVKEFDKELENYDGVEDGYGSGYSEKKDDDKPVIPEVTENDELSVVENPIDFEKIQEVNPDVCAWIEVDGIDVIDYPILQSAADVDDNYYLDHDIYGNSSVAGAIYIQKLNSKDFSDRNTLIYGQLMLNGTMFGQLKKFRNAEFFNENRYIYIYTPDYVYQYEIVSAFVYDNRHIINSFDFDNDSECQAFFDEVNNPSSYTKQVVDGLNLTTDDKIITLSTCTSNDSERYLVVGKLIKTAKTKN